MNELLHTLGRGFALGMIIVMCGLTLPALGSGNGDVIKITADCEYAIGVQSGYWHALGTTDMALASNLCDGPVYLTGGWEESKDLAAGIIVRAFVRKDGAVVLANGVQLNDGRVMVDGQILDRVDP